MDAPEPRENATPREQGAKPSPTKNILFLAFILLSVLFCAQRFRMRLQRMDYNTGIALYNQGIELLERESMEEQKAAAQIFQEAQDVFLDAELSMMDPGISQKAREMQARCLAMQAQCPGTLAQDAISLYRKAMILDLDCDEVRGLLRIHLEPMSPAERAGRLQDMQNMQAPPPLLPPPQPVAPGDVAP